MPNRYRMLNLALGGLALGAVVFAFGMAGLEYAYSDPSYAGAEQQQASERAPESPVTQVAPDEGGAEKNEHYLREDLAAQRGMAYIAAIQLLLTAGGLMLLWQTLEATREAVREASQATGASTKAAEAALQANEQFAAASRAELRPYLFAKQYEFHAVRSVTDPSKVVAWNARIIWQNNGQTPARNVHTLVNGSMFAPGGPNGAFNFPDVGGGDYFVGTCGPGLVIHAQREIYAESLQAELDKGQMFVFWAWIEYSDGYENSSRHRTEICAAAEPNGSVTDPQTKFVTRHITRFNASDGDCVQAPKTK